MTGREVLSAIIHKQPRGRLAWTTLADDTTRSIMPPEYRDIPLLEFYRKIGCDVMMFGSWGLPPGAEVVSPVRYERPAAVRSESAGDRFTSLTESPWGTLTAESRRGHPTKYPVETLDDLRILLEIVRHTSADELDSDEPEKSYDRAENSIGDRGLYFETTAPSPVQQLIEMEIGVENFYYFLQDHGREMEELLAAMHALRMREYEIIARRSRAECIIPVENTSSTLTSPAMYERLSLPQIAEYTRILHSGGKKVILHMCGRLKALLPLIRRTGADGINALTPPELGDCAFDDALDALGEDLIILGGVLPGFQDPGTTPAQIQDGLDRLYTPRLRRANFLLWPAADGLATPVDRFLAVRDWFQRNGTL